MNHARASGRSRKVSMNRLVAVCVILTLLGALPVLGADAAPGAPVPLWADGAPGALGKAPADVPSITVYPAPSSPGPAPTSVVCPGGGYGGLAGHEAEPIARWLNPVGVTGVV